MNVKSEKQLPVNYSYFNKVKFYISFNARYNQSHLPQSRFKKRLSRRSKYYHGVLDKRMASLFSHALVAVTAGKAYVVQNPHPHFRTLGIVCAILPDADVIAFAFGIPYRHSLGHRGFTHSLFFAALLALILMAFLFRHEKLPARKRLVYASYFFVCTASHGVLDALTNGGLGVAFFSPFDNTRYFLPWQPIQVSPIGILNFFSAWGLRVVLSEVLWIGLPCFLLLGLFKLVQIRRAQ